VARRAENTRAAKVHEADTFFLEGLLEGLLEGVRMHLLLELCVNV